MKAIAIEVSLYGIIYLEVWGRSDLTYIEPVHTKIKFPIHDIQPAVNNIVINLEREIRCLRLEGCEQQPRQHHKRYKQ